MGILGTTLAEEFMLGETMNSCEDMQHTLPVAFLKTAGMHISGCKTDHHRFHDHSAHHMWHRSHLRTAQTGLEALV